MSNIASTVGVDEQGNLLVLSQESGKILEVDRAGNVLSSLTVAATFGMASAILQEASLSFLGLGVQSPTPSWGNMLRDAQTLSILEGMPWLWLAPGIMIALAVLSINFIGDGLRDAIDPRSLH